MAYFLFIDESGQDHRASPYEVLAGVAVKDSSLWQMIRAIQAAEAEHFGVRYSGGERELKAKKVLKKKVFKHAALLPPFPPEERTELARRCLEDGAGAGPREMAALAQAKLSYVKSVIDICTRFDCRVFASIVTDKTIHRHTEDYLRKDYSYLFERFFHYLQDVNANHSGIVVFDELEKSQSHILVGQMDRYFKRTRNGRERAALIIPEPFFVHSDLTTGVQMADLAAYLISWGFRTPSLIEPARVELKPFVASLGKLRHHTQRTVGGVKRKIWSFQVIHNLTGGGMIPADEPVEAVAAGERVVAVAADEVVGKKGVKKQKAM